MANNNKETLKRFLGGIPLTAELYWLVRQKDNPVHSRFSLKALHEALPSMVEEVKKIRPSSQVQKKKVFLFAALHYWIEHAAVMGITLAGLGHKVTLG